MGTRLENNDRKNIDKTLNDLQLILQSLDQTLQNIQSPNLRRKLSNIKKQLSSFKSEVVEAELDYRHSLDREVKRRMRLDDERFRTNYNHNTDGRMKGVYYSGHGDMGRKR
ncbi:hypothetical protein [Halalkalibacter akibai]|uniref:Uncharacterized protein n=1 Tax=Halalkalibacter akibai (strain ATCC 43226 / DSM 21942 / CIP 109018 / JCM 9157 / 1139) TaxID=1236973 RepID=W4QR00_HALA3|nr:hypothetical protein [Halalkalibacter akibai]GAE34068.1 hypothetical protein JCM9157_1101 [Halalkalibacter akibai JCM 9157]